MFKGFKIFIREQWKDISGNAKWSFIQWTFAGVLMIPSAIAYLIKNAPLWEVILVFCGVGIFLFAIWCWLIWFFLGKGKSGIQEKSDLEIEPIPTKKIPAREHPCKILIHNKSLTQNADELKVELVSFTDEISKEQSKHYHPPFPLELKSDSNAKTINPNDSLTFTAFYVEMASKIQDRVQKFTAKFVLENHPKTKLPQSKYALFQEKSIYPITFAASARGFGFARIEKEFRMEFFNDDGICKIVLTPFVPLTKEEIRQKSEKALEKLTGFSTIFFQRINSIKAISPADYNSQKDDALWNANDAAIAYIVLNLNQDAGKVYDDGVAEINSSSVRQPGVGSTRYEDDYNVVLARFNRRLLNIKRIVDDIEKYIK